MHALTQVVRFVVSKEYSKTLSHHEKRRMLTILLVSGSTLIAFSIGGYLGLMMAG